MCNYVNICTDLYHLLHMIQKYLKMKPTCVDCNFDNILENPPRVCLSQDPV